MGAGIKFSVVKDTHNAGIDKLKKQLKDSGKVVHVGIPSGGQHGGSTLSNAEIGAIHEYGAPGAGIPERPFLAVSIKKEKAKYQRLNKINLVRILHNQIDFNTALGQLGEMAKGDVQQYVVDGNFAPLKAETVRKKGSSKPLIDTGQLRQSINWEIADGQEG